MRAGALFIATLLARATALDNTTSRIVAKLASYGVDAYEYFNSSVLLDSSLSTRSLGFCSELCSALPRLYPGHVLQRSTTAYSTWDASFWSQQQEEVDPACVFQPASTVEVAVGLLLSELTLCPFAVKSGGHAAFAGASNIQDGLTIDLVGLNSTALSRNSTIASVGAGNRWLDVYDWLDPMGLSVIGGRVSDIGVGGLTLGGGISFFSGFHGWACDNVANYEVVLADGSIVDVNSDTHPDLYWALRGPHVGRLTHLAGRVSDILHALVDFGFNSPSDPNGALIVSVAYAEGLYLFVADLEYAKPVANPPIFANFSSSGVLEDTMAIRSLSNITLLFKESNPNGLRESYWTGTVQLDYDLATNITNMFKQELVPIQNVTGIVPALVWQVISTNTMEHMAKNGGNALGLDPKDGPLLLINLAFMWDDEADDAAVMAVLGRITQKALSAAQARGLGSRYLYMNYASQYQSVVPSYGTANQARLQAVAKKYDPLQVFQNLQPGYFKLDGAPAL
ncbi:hypothetical protein CBS147352_6895 [Aspergillus niger]|nr:hypothetical protein CBS147352_6895 [Aspergillus niger]